MCLNLFSYLLLRVASLPNAQIERTKSNDQSDPLTYILT